MNAMMIRGLEKKEKEQNEVGLIESHRKFGPSSKVAGRKLSDIPADLRPAFIAAVQAEATEAYSAVDQPEGIEFVNPMQKLRALLKADGVQVEGSQKDGRSARFTIRLIGLGAGNDLPTLRKPGPRRGTASNRIEFKRGSVTEWYENGRLGFAQGFTVHQAPVRKRPEDKLTLALELEGDIEAALVESGQTLQIQGTNNGPTFTYGHLFAQDETGRFLPIQMRLDPKKGKANQILLIEVNDAEAVYPLTIDPLLQQQQGKVVASDGSGNSLFGEAVAIYGDTAVVGSYLADLAGATDAGAAYVFVRNGTTWTQQAKLTANDASFEDYFGNSVGIYGDTIVVGASLADWPGKTHAGALYVYVRSGTTWSFQQKIASNDLAANDFFGIRCAIYGDTIVASASSADYSGLSDPGAAYVFTRSSGVWTQQAKLTAYDAASHDFYGTSTDIYQDTAIVGMGGKGLYVYVRSGTTWTHQAKLVPTDSIAGSGYSYSARINDNTIIVGAQAMDLPGKVDAGAAYVFVRNGATWSQEAKLTAGDAAASDWFGYSVDINGNTALVGAPWAEHSGKTDVGAAYIFSRTGTIWTQTDKIIVGDAVGGDGFGYFLALHNSTAVIGAPGFEGTTLHGAAYFFLLSPAASLNTGAPSDALSWAGEAQQDGSVAIRTGEKVETVTDLDVNTPVGAMTFTRTFRQNKRGVYQFMGLGWTHNHALSLTKTTGTPNRLTIEMDNGGELKLAESAPGSNLYLADSGSDAKVTWNAGTSQYTLTGSDKSTYVFDSVGKLVSRSWANGESWAYTYTSGKLTSIDDGYGRGLRFVYRSNPGQFDDGQLWRVGDHMSSGLSGSSPTGRYIEFTYTTQKSNGTVVASPKALLNLVRDVRGNTWTHKYYGQVSGQSVAAQLDFLLETVSPQVDTDGNGSPDTAITLEKLTYTTSGSTVTQITREQGNNSLSTAYTFQASGQNVTNETTASLTHVHQFSNGVYAGTTDPAQNAFSEVLNLQYRPIIVSDANGNNSQMEWTLDGKLLVKSVDALGNQTSYTYNTSGASADTLSYSIDPLGRKTEYTYGDAAQPRLPTRIRIIDSNGVNVLRWQEFTYDSRGRVTSEKLIDPVNGTTVLRRQDRTYYTAPTDPVGAKGLLQTIIDRDLITPANDVSTTFSYNDQGWVVKTHKTSMFGCCQFSYVVYDAAGLVVAEIKSRINQAAPTSVAAAVALYDSADPDKNRVTVYEYDSLGRRFKVRSHAGASFEQVDLTVYDALGRVTRTITNYVAGGMTTPFTAARGSFGHGANNDQNQVVDTLYNSRGMIRKQTDALDKVTLFGYDTAGWLVKVIQNASQASYNNDYTGTSPDPTLGSYSAVTHADQDIVTTYAYDKAGNRTQMVNPEGQVTYFVYDGLNRVVKTVRAAKDTATILLKVGDAGYNAANDPRSPSYAPSSDPDRDVIETTEYDKVGRVIRTQRLLDNRPAAEWETTLLGYDGLNRSVKIIKVASNPTYNLAADPTLNSYSASGAADLDIVTRTAYDAFERVMYTEDPFGSKTWVGYDGLSRQIKMVINAVGSATDGGVNDPRSATYAPSSQADKDLVMTTTYNSDGRVLSTQDALGRVTRYVYDTVGRVIRIIQNFIDQGEDPALWVYNSGWKKSNGTTAISHGANNDQNQVTRTVYDGQGRVSETYDHRHNRSIRVYDELDRVRLTVVNYISQGASNPASWVWSSSNNRWEDGAGNAISFDTDMDRNRITLTTYDLLGRVTRTRTPDGVETRFTLDQLGRRVQTIANYSDGVYSAAAPDTDVITTTVYNKANQVLTVTDARGTQTTMLLDKLQRAKRVTRAAGTPLATVDYVCLDKAGRTQRLIRNWSQTGTPDAKDANGNWVFVPSSNGAANDTNLTLDSRFDKASRTTRRIINYRAQGTSNPANWVWSSSNNRWEDGAGNPLAHGAVNDQNLIVLTTFFKDGQVDGVTDPEGVTAKHRYDALRRKTRTVQAFIDQGEDPTLWVWDATDGRWEKSGGVAIVHGSANDQNIVQVMTLDKGGRVVSERDPRGNVTTYTYDLLNRRKSLTNPLGKVWSYGYIDEVSGGTRVDATHPGITGATAYVVQQDIDRLGRLYRMNYGAPADTPSFRVTYDAAGNRQKLSEYSGAGYTNLSRETSFNYDALHRMTAANFDSDGNGTVNESVSYLYDGGGLRTRMTLPGNLHINYSYDARGRLISLSDWDAQTSQFSYDLADRRVTIDRPGAMLTEHQYDSAGRLKALKHAGTGGTASFGVTGLKDDFNRANSTTLGANWGQFFGNANLDLNNNQCRNPAAWGEGSWAGNYYSAAQYGPDCELYVTLTARAVDISYLSVRIGGNLNNPNYYAVAWNAGGFGVHKIVRMDDGAETRLGDTFSQSLSDGDSVGIRAVGSTISAYYKPSGGSWTLLASRTDTTYNSGGYMGIEAMYGGWAADNFSGGNVSTAEVMTHAAYEYKSDRRGNRVAALETVQHPATTNDTIIAATDKGLALSGTWSDVSGFKESTQTSATLKLMFLGSSATLTMGRGPDHSIYDLYLNGVFWQSVDGYAATASQVDISIPAATLVNEGPHLLEVRNKASKNGSSSGYKVRFKQVLVADKGWTLHTIEYSYDRLARLLEARYNPHINTSAGDADLLRRYLYTYDRMHNRLSESVALNGGAPTVRSFSYNAANQISNAGYTYDDNGNLTHDGVTSMTWDRANRLRAVGTTTPQHFYDGDGRRIRQTVGGTTTQYLFDVNLRLASVLAETTGASVTRYVPGPQGLHGQEDASGAWEYPLADGLGSVRGLADANGAILESRHYDPYGQVFGAVGSAQTEYGYTGERTDAHGLLDLRARRYHPALGAFLSRDPLPTFNRYGYVDGNPVMRTDPSGLVALRTSDGDGGPMPKVVQKQKAGPVAVNPKVGVKTNEKPSTTTEMRQHSSAQVKQQETFGIHSAGTTSPGSTDPVSPAPTYTTGASVSIGGCGELMTILSRNRIQEILAYNPGNVDNVVYALVSAWRDCPCTIFRGLDVHSATDPGYLNAVAQLNAIRNDVQNVILDIMDNHQVARAYIAGLYSGGEMDPMPCFHYEAGPPLPTPPPPSNIPCISLDPAKVQTTGQVYSVGFYFIAGGGYTLVDVWDRNNRKVTLVSSNLGIGLGGKGWSSYTFVSELPIEDLVGLSFGAELNLGFVGLQASHSFTDNMCSAATVFTGVAVGIGANLSISNSEIIYNSDW